MLQSACECHADTICLRYCPHFPAEKNEAQRFANFSEVTQNRNADFLTPATSGLILLSSLTWPVRVVFMLPYMPSQSVGVLPDLKDGLSFPRGSPRSRGREECGSPSLLHLVPWGGTCQVATAYSWVSVFPTGSEINPVLDTVRHSHERPSAAPAR